MADPVAGGAPADRGAAGAVAAGSDDPAVPETTAEAAVPGSAGGSAAGSGGPSTVAGRLRAVNRTRGTVIADRLEVGDSFGSRFVGLMGRPSLAAGTGLWLPGTGSIHMLFMRFPIDAVFLGAEAGDGSRRVVRPSAGLRPWTGIGWARGARGVLELPAGTIAATGTSRGDAVVLEVAPEAAPTGVPEAAPAGSRRPGASG